MLYFSFTDRFFPTLVKTLRSQAVSYVCCGEDHTVALTKVSGNNMVVVFV